MRQKHSLWRVADTTNMPLSYICLNEQQLKFQKFLSSLKQCIPFRKRQIQACQTCVVIWEESDKSHGGSAVTTDVLVYI